jgi:MerR family transcriptional regulator, light-induced transcriptional regulator
MRGMAARTPDTAVTEGSPAAYLLEQYLSAQLAGDRRAAVRLIDEGLSRGVPVVSVYLDVIQAAQYRIGELWQQNRISIAQEHLATAISQVAIAELYQALECAPPNGKRALVSCVGGELHELGTRITADFLEMAGFEVRYLGANVPDETLVARVREDPPDLLVASVTMSVYLDSLRQIIGRVRDIVGSKLHMAVGGHAFNLAPGLANQIGADVYGRDALATVEAARRLWDPA